METKDERPGHGSALAWMAPLAAQFQAPVARSPRATVHRHTAPYRATASSFRSLSHISPFQGGVPSSMVVGLSGPPVYLVPQNVKKLGRIAFAPTIWLLA